MRIHFEGVRGKTPQTDDQVVLTRTKTILGVKCTVVRDMVAEHGRAVERTDDCYAQDKEGNVWYMGEDAFERNKAGRFVKAGDSWRGGVNGGKPGIIMPADPKPGDAYRQEYYPPGKALDEARVHPAGRDPQGPVRLVQARARDERVQPGRAADRAQVLRPRRRRDRRARRQGPPRGVAGEPG